MEIGYFTELTRYLVCCYKRRYLFLAVFCLVTTCGLFISYRLPKMYEADSTVFIEESVIKDLVKGIAVTPDMDTRVSAIKYTLLGRDFLIKVVNSIDMDLGIRSENDRNGLIAKLQNRTKIEIIGDKRKNNIFKVSILDNNPYFAQKYINNLVRTFVEQNLSSSREETYGANRFLDEQLVLFKNKLDNAENAIIAFRKKQGIFSSVDEVSILADINTYDRSIEEMDLSIDTLRARKKRLESQKKSLDPRVDLFSSTTDRIGMLKQKIAQLLLTYTKDYPEIVRLKAELESLQDRSPSEEQPSELTTTSINPLYQDVQQKILDTEAEVSALSARRNRMKELKAEKALQLQDIPETKKELAVLNQERDSYKNIYQQLLMRMGQSEVSKQMEIGDKTTTFRIVDPAILPGMPVSPNMLKMILLSLVIGIGSGMGAVLLLDNLSGSVKNVQQLTNLDLRVLAIIPTIPDEGLLKRQRGRDLWVFTVAGVYFTGVLFLLGIELLKTMGKI
jgi:protein tyrosine kinase modulator